MGNNPLYMEKIKSTGHVTTEQISFYMGRTDDESYADLGAYTSSSIMDANDEGIAWFEQMEGDFYWEFGAVQAIQFGFGKYTALG